jgi:hypothetical protein
MTEDIEQELQTLKQKMANLHQRILDAEEKLLELLQESKNHGTE